MMVIHKVNREELITNNIRLVHSCAQRFKNRGLEYDDLYQAGCVGLIKAVDGFDESKGFAFSTYAVPVILGEMKRLFRDGGSVKVSRSLKDRGIKLQRAREKFCSDKMREPTIMELAELMGSDVSETAEALLASMPTKSLTCDDDEQEFQIPFHEEERILNRISVKEVIHKLNPVEQEIVVDRYFKGMTQSKTAEHLNISQVQVSRKEKEILLKLRNELNK